ncbi:hypothetical protein RFN25_31685, partial [Mesorhizobium abyssinicae]|uniref:hypothetical protein n=1 Tax=Mesorhizobium abyssinicae TaxID=1209958 RepID=UPI002A23EC61
MSSSPQIFVCPFEAASGENANCGVIDDDLRTIPVEFHLMNPAVALGRLFDSPCNMESDSISHGCFSCALANPEMLRNLPFSPLLVNR